MSARPIVLPLESAATDNGNLTWSGSPSFNAAADQAYLCNCTLTPASSLFPFAPPTGVSTTASFANGSSSGMTSQVNSSSQSSVLVAVTVPAGVPPGTLKLTITLNYNAGEPLG